MKVSIDRSPRIILKAALGNIDYTFSNDADTVLVAYRSPYAFQFSTKSLFGPDKTLRVYTRNDEFIDQTEKIATALCNEFDKTELIIQVR